MKTYVQFRSSKFPPYDSEEKQINPGLWGKRLAEYLVRNLNAAGIETDELIPDDWGWYIPIRNRTFRLGICCGHQFEPDDAFLCFTDPDKPEIRRLFKKIDISEHLDRITRALDTIFRSDPDIQKVHWTTGEELNSVGQ